jgi:hypothetical protein
MRQSASWEANRFSSSQEIPRIYGTRSFISVYLDTGFSGFFWALEQMLG